LGGEKGHHELDRRSEEDLSETTAKNRILSSRKENREVSQKEGWREDPRKKARKRKRRKFNPSSRAKKGDVMPSP